MLHRRMVSTQTEQSEFLLLRELQAASKAQQQEILSVRSELEDARNQAAAALSQKVAETAAERDERWSAKMRMLEQRTSAAAESAPLALHFAVATRIVRCDGGEPCLDCVAHKVSKLARNKWRAVVCVCMLDAHAVRLAVVVKIGPRLNRALGRLIPQQRKPVEFGVMVVNAQDGSLPAVHVFDT